jgi:RTA1 like protein
MVLNDTFIENCTYETCSVEKYGQIRYIPSLDGNALYLVLFSIFLICQLWMGIKHRTWGYLLGMFGGLVLEILGYVARIQLHYDVFDQNVFTTYLIGTTIGPAFFSASIYLCLARIIPVYGSNLMPLSPRTITVAFVCCDVVSLLLQAIGGAMTAIADTDSSMQTGINIMIAGLASQVASMTVFVYLCLHFAWNLRQNPSRRNPSGIDLRGSRRFRIFLYCEFLPPLLSFPANHALAIAIATVTILIRCCFRVAELHEGYTGSIANDEILYMVLEGAMMIIAVGALTIGHPGRALGSLWQANSFHFRERKTATECAMEEGNGSA